MYFGGSRRWVSLIGGVSRKFTEIQTVGNGTKLHE